MNDGTKNNAPKFDLGRTLTTPGVLELDPLGLVIPGLLKRHRSGDWGTLGPEDIAENEFSVDKELRILSAYAIKGEKIWVITEPDRSVTTVLLPSEY